MYRWLNLFLVFHTFFVFCVCERIKIGGLFDQELDDALVAFQYAVDAVNAQQDLDSTKLEAVIMRVPFDNEYATSKKLCKLLKNGVAGIFGPTSPASAVHVRSVCDEKEVPLIQSVWGFERKLPLVNLYPDTNVMEKLIFNLIIKFEWKQFTILYETGKWIPRVAELLEMYDPKGYTITASQLSLSSSNIYRQKLRRVKDSIDNHIIIDCSIESLPEILKQAQQVGLMTDYHQFIITNLDLHTIDLEPYQYSGTNITGFRMIDPSDAMVKQVTNYWNQIHESKGIETPHGLTIEGLRLDTALIYDSVLLFSEAINQMLGVEDLKPIPLQCDDTETFNHGSSIINYMRTSNIRGLTKNIKFDNEGNRKHFEIDVIELASGGIRKTGTWSESHKLEFDRSVDQNISLVDDGSMKNLTLKVLTALTPPYGMNKKNSVTLTGNARYEGFGIELIEKLSEMLGFNYTFLIQEDGSYGTYNNETKTWNGMMKEVIDGRVDLAITDLTITAERENAVDFTNPFMNLGIAILYRKPSTQAPSLFSFMSPFSNEVWMYLGGAYLGVSLCLFILGRISPNEWDNPYPCIEEPDILENQFSVSNSLWFTIGALLQQGSEVAPKTPSTRTIASIWWFFTLIMVSTYTANLAAFLTVEQPFTPIKNAEDLANSDGKIPYGAKLEGSTLGFFMGADSGTFQKLGKFMKTHPQYLTKSNDAGLERVKTENYAFLMESTSIEYMVERNCEVTMLGEELDSKGYGIAMPKGYKYRSKLSEAVLRLQEQGKLTEMKNKWWKEKHGGGACSEEEDKEAKPLEIGNVGGVFVLLMSGALVAVIFSVVELIFTVKKRAQDCKSKSSDKAKELGIPHVLGVFFLLLVGSSVAITFGICEWLYHIFKTSRKYQVTFKQEFIEELKFIIKCRGNTRTIRNRKSSSTTDSRQSGISGRSNHSRNSLTPGNDSKPESFSIKPTFKLKKKDVSNDS